MSPPLLSVCLITYNHVNFIKKALEGVLIQKVNFSWELIIADDFSIDGTREILLEYKNGYPDFIKLILQETNVGAAKNWAALINTPRSKYIAYFEGDDYWTDPHKLQRQVDFLEDNPDFVTCFHNMRIINEDHPYLDLISNTNQQEITTLEDLACGNYIYTASCVFRNNLLEIPDWLYQCPVGDYPLHLLNAQYGKIKFIDEVMGVYRVHKGGLWENKSLSYRLEKRIEMLDIIKNKFNEDINEILNNQLHDSCFQLVKYYLRIKDSEKYKLYLMKIINGNPNFLIEAIKKMNQERDEDIREIINSYSYKVGKIILKPIRIVRNAIFRRKERDHYVSI